MKTIRICCFILSFFLVSCEKSKDTPEEVVAKPKHDSPLTAADSNYYRLLHIRPFSPERYGSSQVFPLAKKKLRFPSTEDFTNDYEIRLYSVGWGIRCHRYYLKDGSWTGERVTFTTEIDKANKPTHEVVTIRDVYPKSSWNVFIQELLKNDLLDMPTDAELQQEMSRLHKLYPDESIREMIDGESRYIEIISKDYYDYRHYDSTMSWADKYPGATVMKKINALIGALQSVEDGKIIEISKYPME